MQSPRRGDERGGGLGGLAGSVRALEDMSGPVQGAAALAGPRIVNANSRSLSLASVSSDGSAESHLVEQEDIIALTQDVRHFKVSPAARLHFTPLFRRGSTG